MVRVLKIGALVLGGAFVALQLVPYGRDHGNPPVTSDAPWPTAESRALARAACYDCHSNETHWPWYSHVAPMSWLVQRDVDRGRAVLNFSEWDREQESDGLHDAVEDGDMPPSNYLMLHPDAKLSAGEKSALIEALEALEEAGEGEGEGGGGNSGPGGGGGGGGRSGSNSGRG